MARTWTDKHGVVRALSYKRQKEQDDAVRELVYAFVTWSTLSMTAPITEQGVYNELRFLAALNDYEFEGVWMRALWSWSYSGAHGYTMRYGSWKDVPPMMKLKFLRDHNAAMLKTFIEKYARVYEQGMRRVVRGLAREYFLRLRREYRKTEHDMFMEL